MGRAEAKALIVKWREKASALAQIEQFYQGANMPDMAKSKANERKAVEDCAEDLDRAYGRIS